jgi:hypothetical protein
MVKACRFCTANESELCVRELESAHTEDLRWLI